MTTRRLSVALAALLLAGSAAALTSTSFEVGYASAVLPALEAWSAGATVYTRKAEVARLYCKYTTHASSTTGYPDLKVQFSSDAAVTWYDYAVCNDEAAGTTVAGGVDEWQARCYTRVWYIDTPGVAATAASFPVLEFDLRGLAGSHTDKGRIRVAGREVGDTTNRGTLACTWGLGMIER